MVNFWEILHTHQGLVAQCRCRTYVFYSSTSVISCSFFIPLVFFSFFATFILRSCFFIIQTRQSHSVTITPFSRRSCTISEGNTLVLPFCRYELLPIPLIGKTSPFLPLLRFVSIFPLFPPLSEFVLFSIGFFFRLVLLMSS